jgi:hypothetical protein
VRWAPTWRAESLALRPTTATIAGMCPRDQLSFPKSYIRAMIVESDRTDAVTVPRQALRQEAAAVRDFDPTYVADGEYTPYDTSKPVATSS